MYMSFAFKKDLNPLTLEKGYAQALTLLLYLCSRSGSKSTLY